MTIDCNSKWIIYVIRVSTIFCVYLILSDVQREVLGCPLVKQMLGMLLFSFVVVIIHGRAVMIALKPIRKNCHARSDNEMVTKEWMNERMKEWNENERMKEWKNERESGTSTQT